MDWEGGEALASSGATVASVVKLTFLLTLLLAGFAAGTGNPAHAAVVVLSRSPQIFHLTDGQVDYAPGELLIGLGAESEKGMRDLVKSWGGVVVDELPEIHAFLIRLDEQTASASLYQRAAFAGFEYVERNYYVHSTFAPNDPLWPSQWAPRMVHADGAWDIEPGEKSVIVAVIDTGVDYHHEDLAGNYLPIGYDWVNHDPDPFDDSATGHGTHVAGVIGAVTDNAIGIAGLAQVNIMAEKVLNSGGSGTIYDVAEGVIDAANKGARITCNAYGTEENSETMLSAFKYAYEVKGVLNIAAAGNGNTYEPFYPAAFSDYAVSVAGTKQDDGRYESSNYGDWIELSAPAVDIVSTLPTRLDPLNPYGSLTGTSMSSAFVTGAAALVLSHCGTMSGDEVRGRLRESAVDLGVAGRDPYFGYGRVDLFSALIMPCGMPVGGTILEPDDGVELPIFEVLAAMGGTCLCSLAVALVRIRRSQKNVNEEEMELLRTLRDRRSRSKPKGSA